MRSPHIVIYICEQQHLLELALAIVLNLSTCLRSLFLVESNFPKMQQSKTKVGKKRRHENSICTVKPPWRHAMEQMVFQYEDSTINRSIHFGLCWETNTSLERVLLSQNCQMATPPSIWIGSWSFLKDSIQNDTLCSSITKWHLFTLSHFCLLIIIDNVWKPHSLLTM